MVIVGLGELDWCSVVLFEGGKIRFSVDIVIITVTYDEIKACQ